MNENKLRTHKEIVAETHSKRKHNRGAKIEQPKTDMSTPIPQCRRERVLAAMAERRETHQKGIKLPILKSTQGAAKPDKSNCVHLLDPIEIRGKRRSYQGNVSGCAGCWLHGCEIHKLCTIREKSPDQRIRHCGSCSDYRDEREPESKIAEGFANLGLIVKFDETNLMRSEKNLSLPEHQRKRRFNSSIIPWEDGYAICYRDFWRGCQLWISLLDKNFVPKEGKNNQLKIVHKDANYGREDARFFTFRGKLHISFTGVVGGIGIRHTNVIYARLNDRFEVEEVFSPQFEGRDFWEKNWAFFEFDNDLYAVYSTGPHRILRIDGNKAEMVYCTDKKLPWKVNGLIRGGASPVRIGDEFWHFFHSRKEESGFRTYCTGLLCFEAKPPFRITRMIPDAIQWADHKTRPEEQYCAAIFVCGAVLENDRWILSSGIHDRWTEIWGFDHKKLLESLVSIPFTLDNSKELPMLEQITSIRNSNKRLDKQIIGDLLQPMDRKADFTCGNNNYVWFWAIGRYFRPKAIVEIGTRFGYSLKAFIDGADHFPEEYTILSFDGEVDGVESSKICLDYFNSKKIGALGIQKVNTRTLTTLGVTDVQLAHVDGDHTAEGCYQDCKLAWETLRSGGTLVVDDAYYDDVKSGFTRFATELGLEYCTLPSLRGIFLAQKP